MKYHKPGGERIDIGMIFYTVKASEDSTRTHTHIYIVVSKSSIFSNNFYLRLNDTRVT